MRSWILGSFALLAMAGTAAAQGEHYVKGYYRSDGTYVAPHMQTNPDSNPYNNWSTKGNVNPYTGQPGNRQPYQTYSAPIYQPVQPSYATPRRAPYYSAPSYVAPRSLPAPTYGTDPSDGPDN